MKGPEAIGRSHQFLDKKHRPACQLPDGLVCLRENSPKSDESFSGSQSPSREGICQGSGTTSSHFSADKGDTVMGLLQPGCSAEGQGLENTQGRRTPVTPLAPSWVPQTCGGLPPACPSGPSPGPNPGACSPAPSPAASQGLQSHGLSCLLSTPPLTSSTSFRCSGVAKPNCPAHSVNRSSGPAVCWTASPFSTRRISCNAFSSSV